MGRTEKSQGLAPPAIRKDIRAKQAKQVINKTIPALLASIARAKRGVEGSELIIDPPPVSVLASSKKEEETQDDAAYVKRKGQGRRKIKGSRDEQDEPQPPKSRKHKKSIDLKDNMAALSLGAQASPTTTPSTRKIRIITTDTLTAAQIINSENPKSSKKPPNTCILSMASPLRPGGGVLTGATSQEEFLCTRTTLHPSLLESFYRLPELGGIWSPDVLVFHNGGALGDAGNELGVSERYWVDVVSAGMLRFPELEGEDGEGEVKKLGKKDRAVVEGKMRSVLRIMQAKGVKKVVLGAWGCGAYGNPVVDIAQAWRKVLDGETGKAKKGKAMGEVETWPNLEEVVFAIRERRMAREFAGAFGGGIEVEDGPGEHGDEDEDEEEDKVAEELRTKIKEMESQLSAVWNPDLKARMGVILDGLKAQLAAREDEAGEDGGVSLEDDASSGVGGAAVTPSGSDDEEEDEEKFDDDDDSGEEEGKLSMVSEQKSKR